MDWVPIVFIVFKVAVFGTGMFFAIKWHYDQGKRAKEEASKRQGLTEQAQLASEREAALRGNSARHIPPMPPQPESRMSDA